MKGNDGRWTLRIMGNRQQAGRGHLTWKTKYLLAVGGLIGALIISACASTALRSTTSEPKGTIDSLSPSPAPPGQRIEPATLLTAQQAKGLTSLPWRLVAVRAVLPAIDIYYVAGGGCTSPRGIFIQQTRTSITIEAVGLTDEPPGTACNANLLIGYARVPLSAPLGTRRLIHAPVDAAWNSLNYLH